MPQKIKSLNRSHSPYDSTGPLVLPPPHALSMKQQAHAKAMSTNAFVFLDFGRVVVPVNRKPFRTSFMY